MDSLQRITIATLIAVGSALAAPGVLQAQHPSTRSGQGFPSKPIRLVVAFTPEGTTEIKERLQSMGFDVAPTTPEEHDKNLRADLDVFSRLVTEAGLKPK